MYSFLLKLLRYIFFPRNADIAANYACSSFWNIYCGCVKNSKNDKAIVTTLFCLSRFLLTTACKETPDILWESERWKQIQSTWGDRVPTGWSSFKYTMIGQGGTLRPTTLVVSSCKPDPGSFNSENVGMLCLVLECFDSTLVKNWNHYCLRGNNEHC